MQLSSSVFPPCSKWSTTFWFQWVGQLSSNIANGQWLIRADSRFVPSRWETSLQSNVVSHWLGANLESALLMTFTETLFMGKYILYDIKPKSIWDKNQFTLRKMRLDGSSSYKWSFYDECCIPNHMSYESYYRADSRFALSQWETALLCNDVSHWLGANLEWALIYI